MGPEELKAWAESLTLQEIHDAGVSRVEVIDAFGGVGIPTDAYNAIVDLAYLLDAALKRAGFEDDHVTGAGS